ncbi:DUF2877 domain-containing protein [Clostridium sp. OS1-26]|uniref:DUF2877 domain-containing protein n=1 Tax=Clostridium sp. OS1-26 TaxID=3070681 RepID=UPI0027DF1A73|nr:DUF2877 domain-containing protein [Clostridium sp. OS1-26]WML37128.1 DUF2877 domain-containing protein [Clostridium sp. OS1-26]
MKRDQNREAQSNLLPLYLKNHSVGEVHSKFNSGLNVQFDNSLIYIGSIGKPLSAFGLNIKEEKLKQILNSVSTHDIVVNKDNKLFFYSIYEIISIDYKEIEKVNLKLPQIRCKLSEIPNTKLYSYLKKIEFGTLIGIELEDKTCKYVDLLMNSDKWDLNTNLEIMNFFSGRGKGLTPSGDDILIGFTLALMMFDKIYNWLEALGSVITINTTTMISVSYLKALIDGYTSEYFIELIKLIDEENIDVIEKIIKRIQSFGHTSGNDTLFGFFLGLKSLTKE